VLREDEGDSRRPKSGQRAVDEGRVVVRVNDVDSLIRRELRDRAPERRSKAGAPSEGLHDSPLSLQLRRPGTGLVQATDGHRHLVSQTGDDLEDQPLRTAWIKAKNELKNTWRAAAGARQGHPA